MTDQNGSVSPGAELQRAWATLGSVIEDALKRSEQFGAVIADTREQHRREAERLDHIERQLNADRAALEQMQSVFAAAIGAGSPRGLASPLQPQAAEQAEAFAPQTESHGTREERTHAAEVPVEAEQRTTVPSLLPPFRPEQHPANGPG